MIREVKMMKRNVHKNRKRKTLKVNENNDIDSIIEIFQKFGNTYNVFTTTLDPNIQYQTNDIKITQTYTKTVLESNLKKMINSLKKQDKMTLIIIDNLKEKKKQKIVEDKIKKLGELENVKIFKIKEKDTFNTLKKIIEEV